MSTTSDLSRLISVVDVETTGLVPAKNDRVVEIAAVVMTPDGKVQKEICSLVNPERDVGPTHIHGLTARDVAFAPKFAEIIGLLLRELNGVVVLAGHNVQFDLRFLASEFQRAEIPFPACPALCTMQIGGRGKLFDKCQQFGIPFEGQKHGALNDARATAKLLARFFSDDPGLIQELKQLAPIQWPEVLPTGARPLSRDESHYRQSEPPAYLQKLMAQVQANRELPASEGGMMAYAALLDRVLEDRRIEMHEEDALIAAANEWRLNSDQIRHIHHDFLYHLAAAAVAHGPISDRQRQDLQLVSTLLGEDHGHLDNLLSDAGKKIEAYTGQRSQNHQPQTKGSQTSKVITMEFTFDLSNGEASSGQENHICELSGQIVCFTGEMTSKLEGIPITRELAEDLARRAGLLIAHNVTKKTNILVVTDPYTSSGKAEKARRYGTRIMEEAVFWRAIGVPID